MATTVSTRQYGEQSIKAPCTKRLFELSLPKQSKRIWLTDYGPRVLWGNQDTIRPMKSATLKFEANERTRRLATPKPNHKQEISFVKACDRSFWTLSRSRRPPPTPEEAASHRTGMDSYLNRLATPKQAHRQFTPNRPMDDEERGREAQIWTVSKGALNCDVRPRTAQLAQSKRYHRDYVDNREPETTLSSAAKKCETSERIRMLSRAKSRPEEKIYKATSPEFPIRMVTPGARKASPSLRTVELSRSRGYKEGYVGNRSPYWSVSKSARRGTTSTRITELATPVKRELAEVVTLDPNAYVVSSIALKAICTDHVAKLAQPIRR